MSEQSRLGLYDELDKNLSEIKLEDYILPEIVGIPKGSRELGPATEQMKRLWTLWARLRAVNEGELGSKELLKRAVHTALSFEIGSHFDCWRARAGINSEWQVYAVTSH